MNIDEFNHLKANHEIVLAYYSNSHCGVCHTLRPKLQQLVKQQFGIVKWIDVNTLTDAELSGQNLIMTVPTVQIIIKGKEYSRISGIFSVNEVILALKHCCELSAS